MSGADGVSPRCPGGQLPTLGDYDARAIVVLKNERVTHTIFGRHQELTGILSRVVEIGMRGGERAKDSFLIFFDVFIHILLQY